MYLESAKRYGFIKTDRATLKFMTGTTLTNKTAPRLLELSRNAITAMVGPSAIPSSRLVEAGANILSGSVVVDPGLAKAAVDGGTKAQWRAGIKKFTIDSRR